MRRVSKCLVVLLVAGGAQAQLPAEETPLEEVVVNGEFPGPGMWKVTRANDTSGHTLWIIGDPPPLPKRIQWKSKKVEAVVVSTQEILRDSSVTMKPDEEIGLFRGLSLLPAVLKARKNPEEGKLKDLLPPVLYARWQVQKRLYLGRESGVEEWRPIFAADKLRKGAYDELKLRDNGMVWDVVGKLAKQHKIRVTSPTIAFTIKRAEIRAKIKEFSRESLSDVECFATTLDLTEALSDRDTENSRARAWATGDLATLSALPPLPSPTLPCVMAVMSSQVARELIPADIREQLRSLWMDAAQKSIAANQTTFAIVPLVKLMRDDGYLARLQSQGYLIEAPN
ncbi:MAG: TraB/GumN family protein [Pseudomonadota bacterium]